MGRVRRRVADFVEDVRSGFTDEEMMEKYRISRKQLMYLYDKLLEAGLLTAYDLEKPTTPAFEATVELEGACSHCGALKFMHASACPQCGRSESRTA